MSKEIQIWYRPVRNIGVNFKAIAHVVFHWTPVRAF